MKIFMLLLMFVLSFGNDKTIKDLYNEHRGKVVLQESEDSKRYITKKWSNWRRDNAFNERTKLYFVKRSGIWFEVDEDLYYRYEGAKAWYMLDRFFD